MNFQITSMKKQNLTKTENIDFVEFFVATNYTFSNFLQIHNINFFNLIDKRINVL